MKITTDVTIIGAGVMGTSIALELSRTGRSVVVIDKAGGIGHGSTSASSAVIRFNYSTGAGVALAWESLHAWRTWENHIDVVDPSGLARYVRTGGLVLDTADADRSATIRLFEQVGVPWEIWSAAQITERLPHVDIGFHGPPKRLDDEAFFNDPSGRVSGLYTADSGFINDPQLAAHNLGIAAEHAGARLVLRQAVTGIERSDSGSWETRTDDNLITSAIVVNAAGPWSNRVNSLAGVGDDFSVRSRPLRQEVHHVPAPAGYDHGSIGVHLADPGLGIYLGPSPSGDQLVIGGTEPDCDPMEWVDDPDVVDVRPTVPQFATQVTRAARRLPDLTIPNAPRGLAGVYDASDDWAPIYDRTSAPGFYVAMGTSGNQFKNAPTVGHLMAELIAAVESGHDHDHDPVTYHGPHTGLSIDLGAFSRLRDVDPDAPTSVLG